MINDNKNEAKNEKQITKTRDKYINIPRPRHGRKYTKYKLCLTTVMAICIKQQLSNN